jgi:UDP-glucose 4-epimerase
MTNQTFNLAHGKGSSLVELAGMIGEEVGREPVMRMEPSQRGEVTYYVANIGKARALLGYEPKVPLREGIHRTVQWWRETGHLPSEAPGNEAECDS